MIATSTKPFEQSESDEVETRFLAAEFPDTEGLLFGEVMQACWRGSASIEEACGLIEANVQQMQKPDQP